MMVMSEDAPPGWRKVLLGLLLGLVVLTALAFALGATVAVVDGAPRQARAVAAALAGLAVAGAAGWGIYRLRPWSFGTEPMGPRTRQARLMVLLCVGLGMAIGIALSMGTWSEAGPAAVFSDAPLPPLLATVVLALWLIVVPAISWIWFRSVDEHEARSYNFGGLIALHVYYFALPAWWLAWRGGLLPEPQHGILFAIVTAVWCLAWIWRRYR